MCHDFCPTTLFVRPSKKIQLVGGQGHHTQQGQHTQKLAVQHPTPRRARTLGLGRSPKGLTERYKDEKPTQKLYLEESILGTTAKSNKKEDEPEEVGGPVEAGDV